MGAPHTSLVAASAWTLVGSWACQLVGQVLLRPFHGSGALLEAIADRPLLWGISHALLTLAAILAVVAALRLAGALGWPPEGRLAVPAVIVGGGCVLATMVLDFTMLAVATGTGGSRFSGVRHALAGAAPVLDRADLLLVAGLMLLALGVRRVCPALVTGAQVLMLALAVPATGDLAVLAAALTAVGAGFLALSAARGWSAPDPLRVGSLVLVVVALLYAATFSWERAAVAVVALAHVAWTEASARSSSAGA